MGSREKIPPARSGPESRPADQREIVPPRNQWFYDLGVERKQEKLFELEVLLKGLDRFFNLHNQPISQKEAIITRDFSNELRIIRNAVSRVVRLTQGLLTEEDNQALHFKRYVETSLLSDFQRAKQIERALLQRTPEESLYVLCQAFINFQEILHAVTGQQKNSYFIFYHLEHLISREIASNRFFNPFKAAGFAPHYDVVKSPRFIRLVRSVTEPSLRRSLSILFLMMFKLLRYLSFISTEAKELDRLKDSLLIFALIHSEVNQLVEVLESELPPVVKATAMLVEEQRRSLLDHMDSLAYQLSIEIKKMFELELKDGGQARDINLLRAGITRSRGLLTNIFQQGIIHLAQVIDPGLDGKLVFPDFISRLDESLKVRRDVWLFHRIIDNMERVIDEAMAKDEPIPVLEAMGTLRNFIFYYQNVSFQYVRCDDREDFQKFFEKVGHLQGAITSDPEKLREFRQELHAFKMFLETTLASINNRTELRNTPFGAEEGERILAQFLS
jgi:hypothetical protein